MHRYFSDSFWWLIYFSLSLSLFWGETLFSLTETTSMRITSRKKKKKKNGPTGCVRGCVFALYDGRPFKGRWNNNNNSEVRTKQKRGVSQCKNLAKRRKWLKKPSPTPPQWPPPLWMRSHFLGERFFSFFSSYSWREYVFFFSFLFIWLVPNLRQWVD